jgi:quercetin dioxygenase-like cupin family protein
MTSDTVTKHSWDGTLAEQVSPTLERRLITGDRIMLARVSLKAGCLVPKHQHENEQVTQIVDGALHFWIGEDESEEIILRSGDVLCIPSNQWHKVEALEDTTVIDVFSPPRQDWLDKTDTYLRK